MQSKRPPQLAPLRCHYEKTITPTSGHSYYLYRFLPFLLLAATTTTTTTSVGKRSGSS